MKIYRLLQIIGILVWLAIGLPAQAAGTLTVAVVPQFPTGQIFQTWSPVLAEISRTTGMQLELKLYRSIPEFEHGFRNGEVDLAYMNPYHAVMAKKAAGYEPLIRDGRQRLAGILVVRKDSPVTQLSELDGASLAFPAPNAFGASLYMRALLTTQAGIRFNPTYQTTHSNVYRHVIAGRAAAGGGVRRTLESEPPEVREQLRVLYETPEAFPHPLAAHPRVGAQARQAIQAAFIAMGNSAEGKALLAAIQIPEPTRAAYADYRGLNELGLEHYVVLKGD